MTGLRVSSVAGTVALALVLAGGLTGQTPPVVLTVTDGQTPPALTPGTPSGAYVLSEMESINPLTGRLSFAVPLLTVGGRGEAGYTIRQRITTPAWRIENTATIDSGACGAYCQAWRWSNYPTNDWWNPTEPGFTPGTIIARTAGEDLADPCHTGPYYGRTFTHLVFTAPDGTEHKLYDKVNKGISQYTCPGQGEFSTDRGTIFEARDGSGMTFEADQVIYDSRDPEYLKSIDGLFSVSGTLKFLNGVQYQFDRWGRVINIRDRNGNTTTLSYRASNSVSVWDLEKITDPIGRVIRVEGNTITYLSANGVSRTIQVETNSGDAALRYDYVGQTTPLFPDMILGRDMTFAVYGVTAIRLPNSKAFRFSYNRYNELARVELPTGGAIEYDHGGGLVQGYSSGQVGEDFTWELGNGTTGEDPPPYSPPPYTMYVYRRLLERRVYDGSTLQSKTTYSRPERSISNRPIQIQYSEPVLVETVNSVGARLGASQHYYWTSPGDPPSVGNGPADNIRSYTWLLSYDSGYEGKEYRTEALAASTSVVQKTDTTWQTGTGQLGVANAIEVKTTLSDTGQISRQTMAYDQFNNRRELCEYDYSGSPKRKTVTSYIADTAYTGVAVHLRSLPSQRSIYDMTGAESCGAVGREQWKETYQYDHSNTFDPRGNATKSSTWLKSPGQEMSSAREVSMVREYDSYGNITQIIDPRSTLTTIEYATTYNSTCPTRVTKAGRVVTAECDLRVDPDPNHPGEWIGTAKLTNITDANGVETRYSYDDPLDRLKSVDRAANVPDQATTIQHFYNDTDRIVTTTADLNAHNDGLLKTEVVYDTLGREIESRRYVDASNYHSILTRYDGLGRVQEVSNPGDDTCWTKTEYDTLSRPTEIRTCDGAVSTTTYAGNATTVDDGAGKRRTSSTDALGRVTQVIENPGGTPAYAAGYSHDVLDNLTDVIHGDWNGTNILNAQSRTFQYDSHKRLVRAANPESGTVEYEYDDNGNLIVRRALRPAAAAVVTCYGVFSSGTCDSATGYDAFNRALRKNYSDGTPGVTFEYDTGIAIEGHAETNYPVGRLTKVSTGLTQSAFRYDALGRAAASQQTTGTGAYIFGYAYNRAGTLQSMTYPSGRVASYTFNNAGQIDSATFGGASIASGIGYTPHGAIAGLTLGNGLFETVLYNNRLQPYDMRLGASAGSSSVWRLVNGYGGTDNNGNVLQQEITAPGWATPLRTVYKYDAFNRLALYAEGAANESATTCAVASAPLCQQFGYDAWGNRLITDRTGLGPSSSEPPGFSAATNRISGAGFGYDDFGNLTAMPVGTAQYDAENRMTSATTTLGTTQYVYDGEGRRVKKVEGTEETVYVYDAMGRLAAEYGGAPATVAGRVYLSQDHLGSTRVVTNASGTVVERRDYLPFGDEVPASNGSWRLGVAGYTNAAATTVKFTGKERDAETGLDYFGARYLSSAQGRFTSPDEPLLDQYPDDPQSWNLYSYVRNNPLIYRDEDGHEMVCTVDDAGNIRCTVTQPQEPDTSWFTEMALRSLATTVRMTQQTQQVLQSAFDWISQPRDMGCLYGRTFMGAGAGLAAGAAVGALAGGGTAIITAPGGFLLGGITGWVNGMNMCASGSGSGDSDQGSGGKTGRKVNPDRAQAAKDAVEDLRTQIKELESAPNKTPQLKQQIESLKRQLRRQLNRMRLSEEHARQAQR